MTDTPTHEPTAIIHESSTSSGCEGNESGDFECNICFDLPQDPVITLCGHLFCWPCLYKWLRGHSQSHECPVCKALVEEEKVIPLYGRGKPSTDPRLKPVPGVEIPNRPAGQRPDTETLPSENTNGFYGLMGGLMRGSSTSNIGMSATSGGFSTPFFSVQYRGFSSSNGYGGPGYRRTVSVSHGEGSIRMDDENLKKIFCFILFLVVFALFTI